ncbi:hypothetical protein CELL_01689 [Cellulomonas sp. T2.31MG-18]|uniref:hypothetical protein n=1 Tax=Cellulomonas sp. T2.31MG-18 TaxID=3157619 RepID=UPI0035E89933
MTLIGPPASSDPFELANYIEAELLVSADANISLAEVRDTWTSGQAPAEEDLEFALGEIEQRAKAIGRLYPYSVTAGGVTLDRSPVGVIYAFLLLLSLRQTPLRTKGDYERSDPLFDAVIREVVLAALGAGSVAVVFGWPPRGGRPAKFPKAIKWLARQIGVKRRSKEAYKESRDAGVDVVGWRRFPDPQIAFPILLVQNTVQRNFVKKPRDVIPGDWREWLRIKANPQVGFAIPFLMRPRDPWWERAGADMTYVWDRRRIAWQLSDARPDEWPEWPEIVRFVEDELAGLREVARAQPVDALDRPRKDR